MKLVVLKMSKKFITKPNTKQAQNLNGEFFILQNVYKFSRNTFINITKVWALRVQTMFLLPSSQNG